MFVITNRDIDESKSGLEQFGSKTSKSGANDLRIAEATFVDGAWDATILPDELPDKTVKAEGLTPRFKNEHGDIVCVASQLVAKRVLANLQAKKRDLVLFVHGYNNDMEDVLNRAARFEENFDVEVLAFSWPANGGGLVGTASYLSDKRDAQASVGALSRVISRLAEYLDEFNKDRIAKIEDKANADHPDNDEEWNTFYAKAMNKACPFRITLVLHSMGNYVFEYVQSSSVLRINDLVFDNVVLAAADTNNEGHAAWVDTIQCRNRVYITINEDDIALRASRMKAGDQQKARLGHYTYNLNSQRAHYINFTDAPHVGESHAYFEESALKNPRIKKFFSEAFTGQRAEENLKFDAARNLYHF